MFKITNFVETFAYILKTELFTFELVNPKIQSRSINSIA